MYETASIGEEIIIKNETKRTLNTIYPSVPDITSRFSQNKKPKGMRQVYFSGLFFKNAAILLLIAFLTHFLFLYFLTFS